MEKRYIAHKKSFIKLSTALLFVSSVFLVSCKQVLLPQPGGFDQSKNSSGSITTEWTAPTDLKVTQGLQGRIELTWKPVLNAVRYFIYRSDTPFGNFVQVGETTDALYTQKVPAGTDTYYKITAINLQNQETDYSIAVRGTSLAQPVISDIQGDAQEGDSTVTVYWYMNNVDAYADAVRYELVCYDATGKEQKRIPGESGNKTELTVTGLTPNTTYLYQVEAYNIAEQDKTEASDKIDAQTARRLRPNPPENLTVSQGAFGDKVEVSFVLPTKVDVAVEKNVYEQKPLYFKIYRKLAGEDDSLYLPVCAYLGSITSAAGSSGSVFAEQYTPGETVTWEDTNIVRGKQYEYKVQSYADDIESRVITSDKSIATSEPGWAVAPISFEMDPVIYNDEVDSDGNPVSHETAKLSAKLTFDMQGKDSDYSYDLTVNYRRLNNTDGSLGESTPAKTESFTSLDDLNAFIYEATLETNPGSYFFSVNVKHGTSGWTETVTTTNSRYVVADLQPLVVQNLTVADGYPDKFILTWDRDPSITYEIKYREKDSAGDEFTLVEAVPAEPEASSDGTQNYTYEFTKYDGSTGNTSIKSGDAVYIQIIPFTDYNGDTKKAGTPESPDQLFYTLGTPAVTFDETKATADSITVSWPKIEKATSYEVTYAYDGVSGTTQILRDGVATTFADAYKADTQIIAVTKEEEIQVTDDITCVIPKPIGYDYMEYSGKTIEVTVKALNENLEDVSTDGTVSVYTLGPAATGVSATVAAKESSIDVSWKEVPGATGYLIARTRYGATNTDDSRSTDGEFVYFYDVDTQNLTVVGQDVTPVSSVAAGEDVFTLSDTYTDSTDVALDDPTRKFRIEQDKLGWGYPYRYQVFPVKESTPSFVRADNLNQCTVGNVTYQDADKNYVVGSAIGYGLDVKATKAESADTVTVTWTKPYLEDNTKLAPVVYRKASSDPSGKWEAITPSITNTEATVSIASEKTDTKHKAFDYIVKYEEQSSFEGNPHPYYVESLKGDGQEAANKGYYFTILGADASKREIAGNAEELTVTAYDWKERKNGPEAYKVYIKNNNIDGEWHLVATVPVTDKGYGAINGKNDTGIIVSNPAGTVLRFTPEFTDDVHTKYLKVLRDYKHYYKIEAVRTITDSDDVETEITAVLGDDDSIWGARQITAKEFAKATLLVYSYGVRSLGDPWGMTSWKTIDDKYGGSCSARYTWTVPAGKYEYKMLSYSPTLSTNIGTSHRLLSVSTQSNAYLWVPSAGTTYTESLESVTLNTASIPQDISIENFGQGSITFNATVNSGTMDISYNGKNDRITISSLEERRKWIPLRYTNDGAWWYEDPNYGW